MPGVLRDGDVLWQYVVPLTTAASPLLSGWISTEGYSWVIPSFVFTTGTSVHSILSSLDGTNTELNLVYSAPVNGTAFTVLTPFIQWQTVQTVSNATVSKICLMGRV